MVISLMMENNEGATPSVSELEDWANTYGLTSPVLSDDGWGVGAQYEQDGYIPSLHLLGPGFELVTVDGWPTDSDIEAVLPN